MSKQEWQARVRRLAASARYAQRGLRPWSALADVGRVDPKVMPRLCAMAHSLGYPVVLQPAFDMDSNLGVTRTNPDGDQNTIFLRDGMSPASTARVLGHELGHARKNAGMTKRQKMVDAFISNQLGIEDPDEEGACELGTAAFCEAMGIGTGAFLHEYMPQYYAPGTSPAEAALDEAADNAAALWEAVH